MALKDIILTNQDNYDTLVNGGSITKDEEVFTYDEDSVYAVETGELSLGTGLSIVNTDELTVTLVPEPPKSNGDYVLHIENGVMSWVLIEV